MELPTSESVACRRMSIITDDGEMSLSFNPNEETLTVEASKKELVLDAFNLRLWGFFVDAAWSEQRPKGKKR